MACANSPSWATTPAGYALGNTDAQLAAWWSKQPRNYFAKQLVGSFGDQPTSFDCGIGKVSTCTISGCKAYVDAKDQPWTYEAAASVVNLNTYFNDIYDGVTIGQLDYTNEIQNIANTFMPPKDPNFPLGDGAPWIISAITIIFSLRLILDAPLAGAIGIGAAPLLGAAVQTADDQLKPNPGTTVLDAAGMGNYARTFGQNTRNMIFDWANTTFHGLDDVANHTILDYIKGGAFVDSTKLPNSKDIESFYVTQMISRTINERWKTEPVFGTFYKTSNSSDASGPNLTRYFSEKDGGVYYIYQFFDDGHMNCHLDQPQGLDALNGTYFDIRGTDVTKASAGAFRAAGFNYTQDISNKQLQSAITSNSGVNPMTDGASWEGTWTIPICDMGTHNWNIQFGNTSTRFAQLPCCCGTDCKDTAAFVKAANLQGSQTLLRGYYEQLKGTDLDFQTIDYGYPWRDGFPEKWATWETGKRAGITIGIIAGGILAIFVLIMCCSCCLC